MNELQRFFNSIGFSSDKWTEAEIKKVNLKKNTASFNVYIKNPFVIDLKEVNNLFLCASRGINHEKKCHIILEYEVISEKDVLNVLNYLFDELIIKKPSLIGLKNCNIKVIDSKILINVASRFEKEELTKENANICQSLQKYGMGKYEIEILIDNNLNDQVKEEIARDKNKINTITKTPLIFGSSIKGITTCLNNILGEDRHLIIEVYVFNKEVLEKQGKKGPVFILNLKVSDKTDSYLVKIVRYNVAEFTNITSRISENNWYRIYGDAKLDAYTKSMVFNAQSMEEIPSKDEAIKDLEKEKRVELHAHTMMSMMDGVIDAKKLIEFAKNLGHKAVGITDRNSLQAYPDIYRSITGPDFKAIYGIELNVVDNEANIIYNNRSYDLLNQEFVVYDTETTGLNYGVDQMIEIGAVKIKNGQINARFDELINSPLPLSKTISEITNITDEMLVGKDSEENVTKRFLEFCGDLPLVAHNAAFDIAFVKNAVKKYNLPKFDNTVIDTMGMARNIYPAWKNHKLSTLVKNLQVTWDESKHHRADYDCEATAICFYKMLLELQKQNVSTTIELENIVDRENTIKFAHPFAISILVKNKIGLKNLFKIISYANTKYLYKGKEPKIPRLEVINLKEGLIIGSGSTNGEIFTKGKNLDDNELMDLMQFYDYIEVNPINCATHLIGSDKLFKSEVEYNNYVKRLILLGKKAGKLVCATGDVYNLRPEDLIYRKIIIHQKTNGRLHPLNKEGLKIPNMYFMTTKEMLNAFNFLDQKTAHEIVVTNPNKIADMIESVQIIKDKLYTPALDNSANITKEMVYQKAHEIYGQNLPKIIAERLEKELNGIINGGYDVIYLIAEKLVKKSNQEGYFVGSRGSVGSSLVATMMGITEVNGLPPHYICPKCKQSYFEDEKGNLLTDFYTSGYDMPDRLCKCGAKLKKEGQDIPFATFLGFKAEKVPDIDLNFSGENQADAHNYVKVLFGEDHAYRAGTISTVAKKTAFGFVRGYIEDNNIAINNYEVERLALGCTGVKRTTGQHPGGIIVIPQDMDVFDFTPYQYPADEPESSWYTTHFDFHAIHDNVLKLDILGHDDPTMLKNLGDATKINILDIPFDDQNVISLFTSPKALKVTEEQILCKTGTLGVPEFGTNFSINMLIEIKPTHFADLVKIAGLAHGTNVWQNNVRDLIVNKVASFKDAVGCRDDIMNALINYGMKDQEAFKISEFVRKGKAKKEPDNWAQHVLKMREYNVPEWFIECCHKIEYMFPKAHACAYVMMAYRVAWFKVYYPLNYYSSYFSIRRSDFDIPAMLEGYDGIKRKLLAIKEKGYDATVKESAVGDTLAVALEMLARGFTFKNISLEKSLAKEFLIDEENKALYIPFMALDGLGEAVANKIVEERSKKPFYCVEDFAIRGKVNQTAVEALRQLGVFAGMRETSQLSLF